MTRTPSPSAKSAILLIGRRLPVMGRIIVGSGVGKTSGGEGVSGDGGRTGVDVGSSVGRGGSVGPIVGRGGSVGPMVGRGGNVGSMVGRGGRVGV